MKFKILFALFFSLSSLTLFSQNDKKSKNVSGLSKGTSKWYITLDKYGSDNNLLFKDVSLIENTFLEGKKKIEELKK